MAAIAKSGTPTVATRTPPQNEQIPGLVAGEAIAAFDACTIASDGTVMLASGTEAVRGVAAYEASTGEPITLFRNVRAAYGSGLTPGTTVRLSATVGGGLDDAGTGAILGFVVDTERIQFVGL